MPELTPEIIDGVVAACKAGADEAGEALSRTLDATISVAVGRPGSVDIDSLPDELSGPGLAVVLVIGGSGAILVLPESSGLVPEWCAQPDATGESKLTTLAQELGMLLLPEELMPDDFKTARVKNLSGALRRGGVGAGAAMVPLELSADDKRAVARLIWPAPTPSAVVGSGPAKNEGSDKAEPQSEPAAKAKPAEQPKPKPKPKPRRRIARLEDLPPHCRSLLRIEVPVVVTLAEKRQPLGRIVELGPGSIIQFEKSCEDMLELSVVDCLVATGEAVKVGDKFGLRVTSVILPEERFHSVKPQPDIEVNFCPVQRILKLLRVSTALGSVFIHKGNI